MSDSHLKSLFGRGTKSPTTNDSGGEVVPDLSPVARIVVCGVGGGGGNAVNNMIEAKIEGVEFVAFNTDAQALYNNKAKKKVKVGSSTTKGLGAGANPAVGKSSAEESSEEIRSILEGADMVFITCGLGGGTGTGGAPVIAEIAKELGALTVAVVTKPFSFEGTNRTKQALEGLKELEEKVDTKIVIPNDRILQLIDKKSPLTSAFKTVDDVLRQAIEGISKIVVESGLINVDFADVVSVMKDSGSAMMGIGFANGENRAAEAARSAIESPLMELSIDGAKGILFNITGGNDLSMFEVNQAAEVIAEKADPDANIIFGAVTNEDYTGEIKVTVIATGFDDTGVKNEASNGWSASSSSSSTPSRPQAPSAEDLEVPAFLRKNIAKSS